MSNTLFILASDWLMPVLMIVLLIGMFWFMSRSQKKKQKEEEDMRNSLEVGDEITTIGGIVGEIVSIKGETVTIETGKARTKIRFLKSAIRNVDVSAAEKRGEKPVSKNESNSKIEKVAKVDETDKKNNTVEEIVENEAVDAEVVEADVTETAEAVEEATEETKTEE